MFDCLSCTAELTPDEVHNLRDLEPFSQWNGDLDNHGKVALRAQNLKWNLHPESGRLSIKGSLPSFVKGNNMHLLTYPEIQVAVSKLAAAVGLLPDRLIVRTLELSVDLILSESPRPFMESLEHHRRSKFCIVTPPNGTPRPWEYLALHGDYKVKFYDKGAWAAHKNMALPSGQHKLRYEVVCSRARPINALLAGRQATLADLATPDFFKAAAAELHKHWGLTVRRVPFDCTGLKVSDSTLLHAGASADFWRGLKKSTTSSSTIQRTRTRYKELVADAHARTELDVYSQQFPVAVGDMLATLPTVKNDTFLHTCNQEENGRGKEGEKEIDRAPLPKQPDYPKNPEKAAEGQDERASAAGIAGLMGDGADDGANDSEKDGAEEENESYKQKAEKKFAMVPAFDGPQPARQQRYCLTCGRPLSSTSSKAKFCSEKEWGAAAKKCRNAASNPRNNTRRSLRKIESEPLLFDHRPFVDVPEPMRAFVLAKEHEYTHVPGPVS